MTPTDDVSIDEWDGDHAGAQADEHGPVGDADDTESLVRRAVDLVAGARPVPLSTSVKVQRDELLTLLDAAVERLPEEVRAARWLLRDRDEFLAQVAVEGEEILDAARARAERMVQRTEVVNVADRRARKIVDAAEAEARRVRHECEDFCDRKLADLEVALERTSRTVAAGRQKLQGTAGSTSPGAHRRVLTGAGGPGDVGDRDDDEPFGDGATGGFFDQDQE